MNSPPVVIIIFSIFLILIWKKVWDFMIIEGPSTENLNTL